MKEKLQNVQPMQGQAGYGARNRESKPRKNLGEEMDAGRPIRGGAVRQE